MCHFHSVIVTGDGKILHLACNSHSSIASLYGLGDGLDAKWYECEWNGIGSMPVHIVDDRGKGAPPAVAERAAVRHYEKLALIMSGAAKPEDIEPFNEPEYSDVRSAVVEQAERRKREADALEAKRLQAEAEAKAEAEAQEAFNAVDDQLGVLDNDVLLRVIWKLAEENGIDMEDIAADEIQELKDAAEEWDCDHPAYQAGVDAGYEHASEDLYSMDYIDENIGDLAQDYIRENIAELAGEEITEAHDEGYSLGYRDAKQGKAPEVSYFIDGMPSFLF